MRALPPLPALPSVLALSLAISSTTAAGCVTANPTTNKVVLPDLKIVAHPTGPDALEVYDAETLFKRGLDLLEGEAWAEAAAYFERIITEFPDDSHVVLAHYNRGVCYLRMEDGPRALAAFEAYMALLPEVAARDRLDGRFKIGQALAVSKRYEEVAQHFDLILVEEGLTVDDRIEALVDSGVGHFMRG